MSIAIEMRKIFLIVSVFGIVLSFSGIKNIHKQQVPNFQGHWRWAGNASSDRYNFELTIVQNGSDIKGYHSIVAMAGDRVDYGGDPDSGNEPSIVGKIENDVVTITFESGYYPNSGGTATLRFIAPNKIEWNVIKRVKSGGFFPDRAILMRE